MDGEQTMEDDEVANPPRPDLDAPPPPSSHARRWAGPWVVGAVALALRWWMPGQTIITTDEVNWQFRSKAFGEAIRSGHLSAASPAPPGQAATRPGITTMWTGELARVLVDPVDRVWSALGLGTGPLWLRIAHVLVALWCTIGLVAFTFVARRLVGARAALVAGGLLAVEPLLVGHSAILHTDALVTTYAALAIVCLTAALEVGVRTPAGTAPDDDAPAGDASDEEAAAGRGADRGADAAAWWREPSVRLAVLGGAAGAVAVLTKLNAVLLVGVAVLVLAVAHGARRGGDGAIDRRRTARHLGAFAAGLVVLTVLPWPSLWADPIGQYRAIVRSGQLAGEWDGRELLLGRLSGGVDRRFYGVVAWYRASAWLLVASLAVVAATAVRVVRRRRSPTLPLRVLASLTLPPLAYLAALLASAKHYDRYLLPLLPFAALGIGVVVAGLADRIDGAGRVDRLDRGDGPRRPGRTGWVGWAAFAVAAAWTASLAPFAISHVDPLVGGQRAAVTRMPLGWNEGVEHVFGRHVAPGGVCTTVSTRRFTIGMPGCWAQRRWTWLDGSEPAPEYVLIYVADRQRGLTTAEDAYVRDHAELVDTLEIDGVTYVELWHPTG